MSKKQKKPKHKKSQDKSPTDLAALENMILMQQGMAAAWDQCVSQVADEASLSFLQGKDEAAMVLRDLMRRFQRYSSDANGLLCKWLTERSESADKSLGQ